MKKKVVMGVLVFMCLQFFGVLHAAIPAAERAALIALYNHTNGDNWTDTSGWKTAPLDTDGFAMPGTEGSWAGITVVDDRVNEVFLQDNNLNGTIPTQLGNLSQVVVLKLGNNHLSGSIPATLGNLSAVQELSLGLNQLSGTIPPQLGNLAHLEVLSLDYNSLSGTIPAELGNLSQLRALYLFMNQLTGSIPTGLSTLSLLTKLALSDNQLTGTIPSALGNLSNLRMLVLNRNQLSGSIPPSLGNLSQLEDLILSDNLLSGVIPTQLGNLSHLSQLSLSTNNLTGSIPTQLGNLIQLTMLDLYANQLSGNIPSQLGNLTQLDMLSLFDNLLNGAIPTSLTNLTNITFLDIGYNCLTATDSNLRAWLLSHDPDWEAHQNQCDGVILKPIVTTQPISAITETTAECGGNVTLSGVSAVTARGVCWNTSENPTIAHGKTTDGTGTGSFTSHITGLSDETTYYVRAYATNSNGTSYGASQSFTTLAIGNTPTITTLPVSAIGPNSAQCGGNVTADGGFAVTARGVCWNTTSNPTIANSKTTDSTGTGSFSSAITDLEANTKYYVRAYATNSRGTAYGANKSFTTGSSLTETLPPFGSFETPLEGASVTGSIAVTGWALDDGGLASVKIYLLEGDTPTYIGEALFVEGARPDIAEAYPQYPGNTTAGWGYMLLTYFLPNAGNGTYVLSAMATDLAGKTTLLGTKTIDIDNAHAEKPFGAIDTPTQGGMASGNAFVNWGWALTPQPNSIPTDGSTISVWVDGVNQGHPVYNNYRQDIATLFPGYSNSQGAVGYFILDTTPFTDGVHTIQWTATDNEGNTDGIGSRYFSIQNTTSDSPPRASTQAIPENFQQIATLPEYASAPVYFSTGFNGENEYWELFPAKEGTCPLTIQELERVEIQLGQNYTAIQGYAIHGSQLKPLPIGSTLDAKLGTFSWSPGPGFLGNYSLVFVLTDDTGFTFKKTIEITIEPKFSLSR